MGSRTTLHLIGLLTVLHTNLSAAQDFAIVSVDAHFERLFSGGFFLESPAVAPDGYVYFSDLTNSTQSGMQAGHIWRYDPKSGTTSIYRSPSGMSNGITFDIKGDMIVAEGADFGGRRITRTEMASGRSFIVAGLFQGRPFNSPNDLTIDQLGRIYFTDPRYLGREPLEQPVMGIYRIDLDGTVHLIAANVWKPNGIAISPDQTTLYIVAVGDYNTNILATPPVTGGLVSGLHSYVLLPDGSVKYSKQLVEFPSTRWGDGMAVDTDGNLYVAVSSTVDAENGVYVFSPNGQRMAVLSTPEKAINLDFGRGADATTLYVTCEHSLYRIRLLREGYRPTPR